MQDKPSPIRPTDNEARALASRLMSDAATAALALHDPETGAPYVARVGVARAPDGQMIALISDLAYHTSALRADPACALLLGEPPGKGDPLAFPRLTLQAQADFVDRTGTLNDTLSTAYLARHPKAQLYIGFADFGFVQFTPVAGHLNGGFGKAFRLTPADLE